VVEDELSGKCCGREVESEGVVERKTKGKRSKDTSSGKEKNFAEGYFGGTR
jgi:hypothetical protein